MLRATEQHQPKGTEMSLTEFWEYLYEHQRSRWLAVQLAEAYTTRVVAQQERTAPARCKVSP